MNDKVTSQVTTPVQTDAWTTLRNFTKARIALGNSGGSLPLSEILSFQLAHANAKDAIFVPLQINELQSQLEDLNIQVFSLHSQVNNRDEYMKRPDLGRRLNEESTRVLKNSGQSFDIVFVITDGLSAEAVNTQAAEIIKKLIRTLAGKYKIAVSIVSQGRVAIGDEIGELLGAKFSVVFIGERPGLSSPQSMGIYTTYNPKPGLTDENRNCISNIHADGLSREDAAVILNYLVEQSFQKKISGVNLKLEIEKIITSE